MSSLDGEAVSSIPPTSTLGLSLGDWSVMAPLSIALGVTALSNEMYVVNEETQLAACFFLFCTTLYKYGGDAIGSYFDAKSQAILQEHNEVEDTNIALAKQCLASYEDQLNLMQDIEAVQAAHLEAVDLMCKVETAKLRHEIRDTFVKNLNAIVQQESHYHGRMQKSMVEFATSKVREAIADGSVDVKSDAFSNALSALDGGHVSGDQDPIVGLFCTHLREYAEDLESKVGTMVDLSPKEVEELQSELNAVMKRNDLEAFEWEAPSQVEMQLIK